MSVEIVARKSKKSLPVHVVRPGGLDAAGLPPAALAWAKAAGFTGEVGRTLLLPGEGGALAGALFGPGEGTLSLGALARALPEGDWHFAAPPAEPELAALALALGGYVFTRYGRKPGRALRLALPEGADAARVERLAAGTVLARDLVNTPTNDMGPEALEKAVRGLARAHKATVSVIKGDDLLKKNFPMIHAVQRASTGAPRVKNID